MTIHELFESQRRFVVPLFQRPYVWEREKQWEPLWEDISSKAHEVFEHRDQPKDIGSHFLGAAVINQIKTFGRQVTTRQVIDGQQRLTTLQVLLIALRDFTQALNLSEIANDVSFLTVNNCRMEQPFEKYKVWPTSADQGIFEQIYNAGSPEALSALFPLERIKYSQKYKPRPRLVEAYLYFYQAIEDYALGIFDGNESISQVVELSNEQVEKVEALLETIQRHLELVVIELEDRDDPQVIFETLNARGEPLLPSDLIRNYVFLQASNRRENVDDLYAMYWRQYDLNDSFWQANERQGRLFRPRIDLFMFHYLSFKSENDISINQLFQAFRDWWNSNGQSIDTEALLAELKHYSQLYESFFKSRKDTRLGTFVRRLQTMDTSTVYPLLLFLYGERTDLPEAEREGILNDIESFLVRRMVARLTAQNYNRFFLGLLKALRKAPAVSRDVVRDYLLSSQATAVRFPDDNEFARAWSNPVYGYITQSRVAMVLSALDLQLETGKQEKMLIDEALTIEHVRPQNPANEADWETLDDQNLIHTFGNLTLLTTKLNSSISNSSFAYKRPEIAKQSRLRLNTYFQDYATVNAWTQDDIIKRTERLFEVAKRIWPYPGKQENTFSAPPTSTFPPVRLQITPYSPHPPTTPPQVVEEAKHTAPDDAIYQFLQQVARDEAVTIYQEIAYKAGLSLENPAHREELARILGGISEYEHEQGRPMLSAVVVHSDDKQPGLGFFDLARKLGRFEGQTEMERLTFYAKELQAVHEYWKSTDR